MCHYTITIMGSLSHRKSAGPKYTSDEFRSDVAELSKTLGQHGQATPFFPAVRWLEVIKKMSDFQILLMDDSGYIILNNQDLVHPK